MNDKPDSISQRIKDHGLRATAARVAILEWLATDRRHPTAELVHESLRGRFPTLSLSTVYATLETLIREGLIRRVAPQSGRLRVDGTPLDHDHAICRMCGGIHDVARDLIQRPVAPDRLPSGLQVVNLHIEYEVLCPPCAAGTTPPPQGAN